MSNDLEMHTAQTDRYTHTLKFCTLSYNRFCKSLATPMQLCTPNRQKYYCVNDTIKSVHRVTQP